MVSTCRLWSLLFLVSIARPSFAEQNIPYCKDIDTSSFNHQAAAALANGFNYRREDLCFRFVGEKSDLVRSLVTYSAKDGWKTEYLNPRLSDYAAALWQTRAATVAVTIAGGYAAYKFSRYVTTKFRAFRRVKQPDVVLGYSKIDTNQWDLPYIRGPVKVSDLQIPRKLVLKEKLKVHKDMATGHEFLLQYIPDLNLREGYTRGVQLEAIYVGDDVPVLKAAKGYWRKNTWSADAWNELSPDAPPPDQRPLTAAESAPPPAYGEHEVDLDSKPGSTPTFASAQPGSPNSPTVNSMQQPENPAGNSTSSELGSELGPNP